jgi:hypothetical protein
MSWTKGLKLRTACNKLHIDPNDGSAVLEYRIEDGRVERRTVETPALEGAATEAQWQQLTREQLASHVMANTVVAYWLYRRLGSFSLLRAAGQLPASVNDETQEFSRPVRQVTIGEFSPLLSR